MRKMELEFQGEQIRVTAEKLGNELWFHYKGRTCSVELKKSRKGAGAKENTGNGEVYAPMPGKVLKVNVKSGQKVSKGDLLVVMEAMKMEYSFHADFDGEVTEVNCKPDDQVTLSQLLVKVTENAD